VPARLALPPTPERVAAKKDSVKRKKRLTDLKKPAKILAQI